MSVHQMQVKSDNGNMTKIFPITLMECILTSENSGTTISEYFALAQHTHDASEITSVNASAITGNIAMSTITGLETALGNKADANNAALTGTPTAPTASTSTNSTQIATTEFVQALVSNAIASTEAMEFKGTIGSSGASVTNLPSTHKKGWTYKVITAGTYVGETCEIGDLIICVADGTTASNTDWTVVQSNIDGAVTGPVSSIDARVAVFNGVSGKVIKDSGFTIGASVPSDAQFTDTVYTLEAASTSKLGGIKVGTNLSIDNDGKLSATDTTYSNATTSADGLMSKDDKTKLNGIANNANNYSLPTATSEILGGIKVGTNLSIDANGKLSATDTTYSNATTSKAGLMSSSDKTKLDSITASTTELNHTTGVTSNIQTQLNGKASSSHNHNITSNIGSASKVTGGSVTDGKAATYTGHTFTANTPTAIDTSKFSAGSLPSFTAGAFSAGSLPSFTAGAFSAGSLPSFTDNIDSNGQLSFVWSAGTLPSHGSDTFSAGALPSLENGFYTPGTAASHNVGTFTSNTPTVVTLPSITDIDVVTSVGATTGTVNS